MEAERLWAGGPLFLQAETAKLTTDTVLLADFAQVGRAISGADLGCASGALMLLLLWREARLQMTGVELQPDAARLAEENLRLNGMTDRGTILCGRFSAETCGRSMRRFPGAALISSSRTHPILLRAAACRQRKKGGRRRGVRAAARWRTSVPGPPGSAAAGERSFCPIGRSASVSCCGIARTSGWNRSACASCITGRQPRPPSCCWRRGRTENPACASSRPSSCTTMKAMRRKSTKGSTTECEIQHPHGRSLLLRGQEADAAHQACLAAHRSFDEARRICRTYPQFLAAAVTSSGHKLSLAAHGTI